MTLEGEFHTGVTGGLLFNRSISVRFGQPVLRNGYWFVDVPIASDRKSS